MALPAAPAGYAVERERGAIVVALPSVMRDVLAHIATAGSLYDAAAQRAGAQTFEGRGAAYRLAAPGGDWLVRHYRRGGAAARVLTDTYLRTGAPRPLRELSASVATRARGVDSPEIVAAVIYPAGIVYRADLATRFVPHSADLAAYVGSAHERESAAAWHSAGALLRTAFAGGVEHVDLNLRNILIAGPAEAPRALLLDLDRARVHEGAVSAAARSRMLERLHRSRRKIERAAGTESTPAEQAAFQAGLEGANG